MKIKYLFLFISFSFFGFSIAFSQTSAAPSWKSPFFTIEVAGSYDFPIQDAKGKVGDFFAFKNYGTNVGWGAQFNFKFGLGPQAQFRPYVTLGYAQLEGRDDNTAWIDSNEIKSGYPLPGSMQFSSTPGSSKIILRIPYVGAGFEYAFTTADYKKRRWIPFAGFEMIVNLITGVYRQTPITPVNPYNVGPIPFIIKSDIRIGIGLGAGLDYRITNGFGLVGGFKWKYANLIGKKSDYLHEENAMNLLDQGVQTLNSNLNSDRNIGYMEIYIGASFFVGKSKK